MQDLATPDRQLGLATAAACRGMDVDVFYHPPAGTQPQRERRIAQAKAICAQCPVITQCRQHALEAREPYGIWGGLSEQERADLLGVHDLRYPRANTTRPAPAALGILVESQPG